MKRALLLTLVLLIGLTALPCAPAQAADPAWASAYLDYLYDHYQEYMHFFLADCSYNGVPELYYEYVSGGKYYMRMANYANGQVYTAKQRVNIGGGDFYLSMYPKYSGGYVWAFDRISSGNGNVDEDARQYVEPHYAKGKFYTITRFRSVIYTNDKRRYYYCGKRYSYSAFSKKLRAYTANLGDAPYFASDDDSGAACCAYSDLSTEYNRYLQFYLKTMRNNYPIAGARISKSSLRLKKGKAYRLRASAVPSYAPDQSVRWWSSDASIATVTDGVVRGVSPGYATITVDISGEQAFCNVRVTKK